MIVPSEQAARAGGGAFSDATEARIEPTLYWRNGSIRYTLDGSEPTAQSRVYGGPIPLAATAMIKAAVVGRDGRLGPVASSRIEVNDRTAPTVVRVESMFKSPTVRVEFSEPVAPSAAEPARYAIEPSIAVTKVELTPDRRAALLVLASTPERKQGYQLKVTGVKDLSPAGNTIAAASVEFAVKAPVFEMAEVTKEQMGKAIHDVPGLPVKAGDAWTINMFVKIEKQPENRTLIAGFGKAAQAEDGGARYLAKFANGLQFWSHNRDVGSRARLEAGRWQMLTATYDGKVLRMYKDGQKIAEGATELSDDENVVNIAPVDPWEGQRRFQGEIRNISIWNGALGDEAVRALKGPDDPAR
jgi:alpha-mannosidase